MSPSPARLISLLCCSSLVAVSLMPGPRSHARSHQQGQPASIARSSLLLPDTLLLADGKKKDRNNSSRGSSSGSSSPQPSRRTGGSESSRPSRSGSSGGDPPRFHRSSTPSERSGSSGIPSGRRSGRGLEGGGDPSRTPGSDQSRPGGSRSYPLSRPYRGERTGSDSERVDPSQIRRDQRLRESPGAARRDAMQRGDQGPGAAAPANRRVQTRAANPRRDLYLTNTKYKVVNTRVINKGAWAYRPGWAPARPWGWGWYAGWSPAVVVFPGWSWWVDVAPSWNVVTLTAPEVIERSVDTAVERGSDAIDVANSDFRVQHGSIRPLDNDVIEFAFEFEAETYLAKADCKQGLLNDERPSALEEAELMHAACSIAFHGFNKA
ncbi:MAG: hypothetical protein ACKOXO_10325 [Cyanobium sp.]